jgi:uncharacterized protein (TIGR02588 family)
MIAKPVKNWLEWTVFAASAVLVVATIGYLAYDAATLGDSPPLVSVAIGNATPVPGGFLLPLTVRNDGDRAAEDVLVEVEIERADGGTERAGLAVPFVPRQARSQAWVTVRADPRTARAIHARALGYREP